MLVMPIIVITTNKHQLVIHLSASSCQSNYHKSSTTVLSRPMTSTILYLRKINPYRRCISFSKGRCSSLKHLACKYPRSLSKTKTNPNSPNKSKLKSVDFHKKATSDKPSSSYIPKQDSSHQPPYKPIQSSSKYNPHCS